MAIGNLGLNKSSMAKLAQAVDGNQVTSVAGYFKGSGGTIIGTPMKLNSSPPQHNPKFMDIKTGPAVKYMHLKKGESSSSKEYPSLYVYLGTIPTMSMASIKVKSPWVNDEAYPVVFSYFTARDENYYYETYLRKEDGTKGDKLDLTGRTVDSVKAAAVDFTSTRDGWFELPCTPLEAMPLYGVCFAGAGMQINFALVSCDEFWLHAPQTWYFPDQEGQKAVASPVLSFWAKDLAPGCFHGTIGQPVKLYGIAPSPKDGVPVQVDFAGMIDGDAYDIVRIYDGNQTLTFADDAIGAPYSFQPLLQRVADGFMGTHHEYEFFMPIFPEVFKAPKSPIKEIESTDSSQDIYDVKTLIEQTDFTWDHGSSGSSSTDFRVCSIPLASGGTLNIFGLQNSDSSDDYTNCVVQRVNRVLPCGVVPGVSITVNSTSTLDFTKAVYLYAWPVSVDVDSGSEGSFFDKPKPYTRGWMFTLSNTPRKVTSSSQGRPWRLIEEFNGDEGVGTRCVCCVYPNYRKEDVDVSLSLVNTTWSDPSGVFYLNLGLTPALGTPMRLSPLHASSSLPVPITVGDSGLRAESSPDESYLNPSQTEAPGMNPGEYGSVEVNGQEYSGKPHLTWTSYGLYNFRDGATKVPVEVIPGGKTFDETSVLAPTTEVVVKVMNDILKGGYHLEYIKLTDLADYCRNDDPDNPYVKKDDLDEYVPEIGDERYWLKGGTAADNYGTSFKLGSDTAGWITVSYEV